MEEVVILGAMRSPIGSFMGGLAGFSATELGALAVQAVLERSGVKGEHIQELYFGNVLQANLGQAPATQVAIKAGLSDTIPATTVNKVCASGMKATMLAAQAIQSGASECVLAVGAESMSNVPYYADKQRAGNKLGHLQLTDGLLKDGLWDVYNDYHMGNAAELCATTYNLSREEQDAYATQSYKRAASAWAEGRFKDETFEVSVPVRGKDPIVIKEDEDYTKVIFEKMGQLKPVFDKAGTVTAANASNLNDGSAAIVLASRSFAEANGYKPLAIIRGFADAAQAPEWFTTAPAKAIPLALHRAGLTAEDIDFYEINEAFSAVCLANNQLLGLNDSKVNVNGGAVAIGHPLGSSGARIITTLLHVLSQNNARYGVAGICNGGGGASAIVLERV